MKSVGIVGSGIGGLSAAIRLASKGYRVTVFEKNDKPGGKASTINFDGFRFDTGPSLLTMIDVLNDLFAEAGENINDYLEVKKLDVLCKYYFEDDSIINAYSNPDKFYEEVNTKTKDDSINIKKYFSHTQKIYDVTKGVFLYNTYRGIKSLINSDSIKTLLQIHRIDSLRTMHKANSLFFKDERLIKMFDRYATYNGSNPYLAPATLNLISHVENSLGGYYLAEGMYSLTESLHKLSLKKGVEFRFNEEIISIETDSKRIISIESEKGKYKFDYFVSNLDALSFNKKYFTLSQTKIKDNLLSTSAMVFYWGMNGEFPELDTHNIMFAKDYKGEFDNLFKHRKITEDPTIYIYVSSKFNKGDAPKGCENWFVMINVPSDFGQNWEEEIDKSRENIIKKIEEVLKVNIRGKIATERTLTPEELAKRTGSYKGSIYGYSSNTKFSAFKRQSNRSNKYSNLFYCGGSSHPGGGIPLVILSGKNVSELIQG